MYSNCSTLRVVSAAVGLFALFGLFFEEKLVLQLKQQQSPATLTTAEVDLLVQERLVQERLQAAQNSSETDCVQPYLPPPPSSDSVETLKFDADEPLFVLSLPNHYDLVLPRYFECAGYDNNTFSRQWKDHSKDAKPPGLRSQISMGRCIKENIQKGKHPLTNCGQFHIYSNMQWLRAPQNLTTPLYRLHI